MGEQVEEAIKEALATVRAGGQPAIVSAIVAVMGATTVVTMAFIAQLHRLAPLVAAWRGAKPPAPELPHQDEEEAEGEVCANSSLTVLTQLLGGAPVAAIGVDLGHRIVLFNRKAEDLSGWLHEQVKDADLGMLMSGDDARRHQRYIESYLADRKAGGPRMLGQGRTVSMVRRDGSPLPVKIDLYHVDNGWKGFIAWIKPAQLEEAAV